MAYKCNTCGNEAEEQKECCGAQMTEKTEAPAETQPEGSTDEGSTDTTAE